MDFCRFCGKGPFPSTTGLKKHVAHSVNCNEAASQEFGGYATNIWDKELGPSTVDQQPSPSPPIFEDDTLPNMPDLTLEEDVQVFEHEQPNTIPDPVSETRPPLPQ